MKPFSRKSKCHICPYPFKNQVLKHTRICASVIDRFYRPLKFLQKCTRLQLFQKNDWTISVTKCRNEEGMWSTLLWSKHIYTHTYVYICTLPTVSSKNEIISFQNEMISFFLSNWASFFPLYTCWIYHFLVVRVRDGEVYITLFRICTSVNTN